MKISEIFYSLQGEALHIGEPTVFIRTFGCNIPACTYCDSLYAREGNDFEDLTLEEIIKRVKRYPARLACLSGGEPLLQDDSLLLIDELLGRGYEVDLETNGTMLLPRSFKFLSRLHVIMDCKCPCSGVNPKLFKEENLEILTEKDAIKFVVKDQVDLRFAREKVESWDNPGLTYFISPVWGKANLAEIAEFVLKNPIFTFSIQLHKIIWPSEVKRGIR